MFHGRAMRLGLTAAVAITVGLACAGPARAGDDTARRSQIERQIQDAQARLGEARAKADAARNAVSQYEGQLAPAEQAMAESKKKYEAARAAESTRTRALRDEAEDDPRIAESQRRLTEARKTHEQARAAALANLASDPDYAAAQNAVAEAEREMIAVRDAPNRTPEQLHLAAAKLADKQKSLAHVEEAALAKQVGYPAIKAELDAASKEHAELEREITASIDKDAQRQQLIIAAAEAEKVFRADSTKASQIRSRVSSAKSAFNSASSTVRRYESQIESLQRKLD